MVLHFPSDHRCSSWTDTTRLTQVPFYMNRVTSQSPKGVASTSSTTRGRTKCRLRGESHRDETLYPQSPGSCSSLVKPGRLTTSKAAALKGSDDKESRARGRETFSGLLNLTVLCFLVRRLTRGIPIGMRILPLRVEYHGCIMELFLR